MQRGITCTQSCTGNPKGAADCPSSHLSLTALCPTCVLTLGSGVHFPARFWGTSLVVHLEGLKNQNELYKHEAFMVLSPQRRRVVLGVKALPRSVPSPGRWETWRHSPKLRLMIRDSSSSPTSDTLQFLKWLQVSSARDWLYSSILNKVFTRFTQGAVNGENSLFPWQHKIDSYFCLNPLFSVKNSVKIKDA